MTYFSKNVIKNLAVCFFACWSIYFIAGGRFLWTPSLAEKISVFTEASFAPKKTEMTEEDEKAVMDFIKTIKLKESEGFSPYPYGNIELIMPMSRAVLFFCDDELYVSLTPKVRDYNYLNYIFKADFDGRKSQRSLAHSPKYRK